MCRYKHISISYNERMNFVARVFWAGYVLFSTLALIITLLQSSTSEEFTLGIIVLVLEGIPQFLVLAMLQTHWEDDFNHTGLQLFSR